MRISDWSSDVCSSDLHFHRVFPCRLFWQAGEDLVLHAPEHERRQFVITLDQSPLKVFQTRQIVRRVAAFELAARSEEARVNSVGNRPERSEEHTSELQSLMRISYAVFCLKQKQTKINTYTIGERSQQQ